MNFFLNLDSPGFKHSASMEVRVGSPSRSGTDYPNERGRGDSGRSWSPGHRDRLSDVNERRYVTQTTEIRTESGGKSFLGNPSKVTGVQDIITRMRAADRGLLSLLKCRIKINFN